MYLNQNDTSQKKNSVFLLLFGLYRSANPKKNIAFFFFAIWLVSFGKIMFIRHCIESDHFFDFIFEKSDLFKIYDDLGANSKTYFLKNPKSIGMCI